LTIGDWWRFAISSLVRVNASFGQGTTTPAEDASFLVLGVLGLPLDAFETFKEFRVSDAERESLFEALCERCVKHRPAAYILGFTEQMGLRFKVDERVLIPRSFLGEIIVNEFEPWLDNNRPIHSILDLCTGSGCLALIAAKTFPETHVYASDISPEALEVARENLYDYFEDFVDLRDGDLFAPWKGETFDVIVTNPPYVNRSSMKDLPPEYEFEPRLALEAGEDGCDVLRRILAEAAEYLQPNGLLFVDIGNGRADVEHNFPKIPFSWVSTEGSADGVFVLTREDLLS
jgi:ribosomal protein L3 glutamine methyltransferase